MKKMALAFIFILPGCSTVGEWYQGGEKIHELRFLECGEKKYYFTDIEYGEKTYTITLHPQYNNGSKEKVVFKKEGCAPRHINY